MHEFKYDHVKTPAGQASLRVELAQQVHASGVPITRIDGFQGIKPMPPRRSDIDPETRLARRKHVPIRTKWNPETEEKLSRMCAQGVSLSLLAAEFRITEGAMIWRMKSLGLSVAGLRTTAAKAKAELRQEWPAPQAAQ